MVAGALDWPHGATVLARLAIGTPARVVAGGALLGGRLVFGPRLGLGRRVGRRHVATRLTIGGWPLAHAAVAVGVVAGRSPAGTAIPLDPIRCAAPEAIAADARELAALVPGAGDVEARVADAPPEDADLTGLALDVEALIGNAMALVPAYLELGAGDAAARVLHAFP